MYRIQGADQKEYGPVSVDVIRERIAQRRADARTLVQAEGTGVWKALADYPELSALLPPATPPQLPGPTLAPAAKKMSGLAVGSLVLGILGVCGGLTSLFGLAFGVVALIAIGKSQGRLRGQGLAITGICLSGLFLLMLPALLLPALAKAKQKAQSINCAKNLRQLALAVRMYSAENNDQLPPATSWCDAIATNVLNTKIYQCPTHQGVRGSYGFNEKLAGRKWSEINPETVVLFEIDGGWNVAGGNELMLNRPRHQRTYSVAFADGSVRQVSGADAVTLRWEP